MRQIDLAALLDVAASTVANWERGKSFPERHLGDVERILGISLTAVNGTPPPPTDPLERELWDLLTAPDVPEDERLSPAEAWKMIERYRRRRRRTA